MQNKQFILAHILSGLSSNHWHWYINIGYKISGETHDTFRTIYVICADDDDFMETKQKAIEECKKASSYFNIAIDQWEFIE